MLAGRLAITAPHLDGSEDVGVWFDAAWATYIEVATILAPVGGAEFISDAWEQMVDVDEPGQPTMENWGSSERAQRGQEAMLAMFGGMAASGAAEPTGAP